MVMMDVQSSHTNETIERIISTSFCQVWVDMLVCVCVGQGGRRHVGVE